MSDLAQMWDRLYWFPFQWLLTTSRSVCGANITRQQGAVLPPGQDTNASSSAAPAASFPYQTLLLGEGSEKSGGSNTAATTVFDDYGWPLPDPDLYSVIFVSAIWFFFCVVAFTLPCWRRRRTSTDHRHHQHGADTKVKVFMFLSNSCLRTACEGWLLAHVVLAAGVAFSEERVAGSHVFNIASPFGISIVRIATGVVFALLSLFLGPERECWAMLSRFTVGFVFTAVLLIFSLDALVRDTDAHHHKSVVDLVDFRKGSPTLLFTSLGIGVAFAAGGVGRHATITIFSTATILACTLVYFLLGVLCISSTSDTALFPLSNLWFILPIALAACVGLFCCLLFCFVYKVLAADLQKQRVLKVLVHKREMIEHFIDLCDSGNPGVLSILQQGGGGGGGPRRTVTTGQQRLDLDDFSMQSLAGSRGRLSTSG